MYIVTYMPLSQQALWQGPLPLSYLLSLEEIFKMFLLHGTMVAETGGSGQALRMNQELGLRLEAEILHQHPGEKSQKWLPTAARVRDCTELVTAQN